MTAEQASRANSEIPVAIHVGDQSAEVHPRHFQISPRGMTFRSSHALPAWTEVSVAMHLPNSNGRSQEEVECHGVVIDCRRQRGGSWKCAVVFLGLSKKDEAKLQKMRPSISSDFSLNSSRGSSRLMDQLLAV